MRLRSGVACALLIGMLTPAARAAECGSADALGFGPPVLVDNARPGADPALAAHSSGALLLTASPLVQRAGNQPDAGYLRNSSAQSAMWRSADGGSSWAAVSPRSSAGLVDPDLTADGMGTLYHVEAAGPESSITRSLDGGIQWEPARLAVGSPYERPWLLGDAQRVVYLAANQAPVRNLYRAESGGAFTRVAELTGGFAKPAIDPSGGIYASYTRHGPGAEPGTFVAVTRIPNARARDFTVLRTVIGTGLFNLDGDAVGADAGGNVYVVWTRRSGTTQPAGVWYAYSRDRGATFSTPVRLDLPNPGELTVAMPTIVAGRDGRVAVAWLQSSRAYRKDYATSDAEWSVRVAVSTDAAGCGTEPAHWSVSTAVEGPVHVGPICAGTFCDVGNSNDSRMGRFITGTIEGSRRLVLGYPTTTVPVSGRPHAVAHPVVVVATAGASL